MRPLLRLDPLKRFGNALRDDHQSALDPLPEDLLQGLGHRDGRFAASQYIDLLIRTQGPLLDLMVGGGRVPVQRGFGDLNVSRIAIKTDVAADDLIRIDKLQRVLNQVKKLLFSLL